MSASAEQFPNAETQRDAATLGMWVFLATELMFFGPLFLSYAYARLIFGHDFAVASRHTDVVIGTINTAVLLTSSFCMALAVQAGSLKRWREARPLILITALLGGVFLVLKAVEYYDEWREHLVPWLAFDDHSPDPRAGQQFFYLYFGMTGLHAVHLTIGIVMLLIFAGRMRAGAGETLDTQLELGGLYWHFVDAIWVVLYPLLYLVERHS